jgi:hypothetical protein
MRSAIPTNGASALVDASKLGEVGTWKVAFDVDGGGPRPPVELVINRTRDWPEAAAYLLLGSLLASGAVFLAVDLGLATKKAVKDAAAEEATATAKVSMAEAIQQYPRDDQWKLSALQAVHGRPVAIDESKRFVADASDFVQVLRQHLPRILRTQHRDVARFANDFARAVEAELIHRLVDEHDLRFKDFSVLVGRAKDAVAFSELRYANNPDGFHASLQALVDAVPVWYDQNAMQEAIARVFKTAAQAQPPGFEIVAALPSPAGVLAKLRRLQRAAARALANSVRTNRRVVVVAGVVAAGLSVASGLATQYFPKAAWGTSGDILTAVTWAVGSTGLVQVARFVGGGSSPIKVL